MTLTDLKKYAEGISKTYPQLDDDVRDTKMVQSLPLKMILHLVLIIEMKMIIHWLTIVFNTKER